MTHDEKQKALNLEVGQGMFQKFKDDHIGIPNQSDAVYYTQAEADAYNATLEGALNSTDPLTAEEAAAYNAAVTGATKEAGDTLSSAEAAAYNATLEGAVSTSDIKTPAVPKKVKDYVDDGLSGKADKLPMTGAGAATENNFMAIDANGNIKDSGKNENSFLTQHQSIKTINSASIVGSGNVDLQVPITDNAIIGNGYAVCSTAAATVAKTVSITGYELVKNGCVTVLFKNDVPANATLNINSLGAKPIYYKDVAIENDVIKADDMALLWYDGTNYILVSSWRSTNIETVTLTCSTYDGASVTGKKVTVNGVEYTIPSSGIVCFQIPYGMQYSVSLEDWNGYKTRTRTYTAGLPIRSIDAMWLPLVGIYIEAADGTVYTRANWNNSKVANSVIYASSTVNVRIALPAFTGGFAANGDTDAYLPAKTPDTDFDGQYNTNQLKSYAIATNSYKSPYSLYAITNYVFPDGTFGGYIGSYVEVRTLLDNQTEIDACLSACGGTPISSGEIPCSTVIGKQRDASVVWTNYYPTGRWLATTFSNVRCLSQY